MEKAVPTQTLFLVTSLVSFEELVFWTLLENSDSFFFLFQLIYEMMLEIEME